VIYYNPADGDADNNPVKYRPKTCFIMTRLGHPVPKVIKEIRKDIKEVLTPLGIKPIDANSLVTGKDFLKKIWNMMRSVPLGIAIITEEIPPTTLANIFYEIGLMQAYGKETLVIKTPKSSVPSDFVRTEYIEYKSGFRTQLKRFLKEVQKRPAHYEHLAELLERNPLLSIDYLRRAYLISGDKSYRKKALEYKKGIGDRAKNSIESLMLDF